MAGDEEHASENTQLLPHNRRLGSVSVQPRSDAESIISSHLSRDELALGSTAVGERLAYNDYTTIDWLHDLVPSSALDRMSTTTDSMIRSKTPSDIDRSMAAKASVILSYRRGIPVKDGWLLRSLAY
jgi:hypothetical protein